MTGLAIQKHTRNYHLHYDTTNDTFAPVQLRVQLRTTTTSTTTITTTNCNYNCNYELQLRLQLRSATTIATTSATTTMTTNTNTTAAPPTIQVINQHQGNHAHYAISQFRSPSLQDRGVVIRCGYTPHYRYAFCAPKHTSRLVSSFTKTSSRSCNCVMSSATSSKTRGKNYSCSSTYPVINKAHSLTTENPFSSQYCGDSTKTRRL